MYTIEKRLSVLETLAKKGGHIGKTCQAHKITRTTFYEWEKDPNTIAKDEFDNGLTFRDMALEITESKLDDVEEAFFENAVNGDTTAQIFYLKTKGRDRGYQDRTENLNLNLNAPIQDVEDLTKLTKAQIGERLTDIRARIARARSNPGDPEAEHVSQLADDERS